MKRKYQFLVVLFVVLLSTMSAYAEIDPTNKYFSTDINKCYTADENGWITGMKATYEISVKDATLFSADYFMTYAFLEEMDFTSRIFDSENYSIDGKYAPYSITRVYYDFSSLSPLPSYGYNAVPAMIGAIIDPEKVDKQVLVNYEKGLAAEYAKRPTDHLLINEYSKQIPVDGLFFIIYFPDRYNYRDIQRYGYALKYMTQFVLELNESGIDFFELAKSLPTDRNQHILDVNTAQLTKDGYSVGVLATEKFMFAAVTDANDYVFTDKKAVTDFYQEKYEKANLRLIAFQ